MSFFDPSIREAAAAGVHQTIAATSTHHGLPLLFECRSSPRVRVALNAQLAGLDPDGDSSYSLTTGTTLDVCVGGLGLSVDAPPRVGLRVVVELEVRRDEWMVVQGRVAWAARNEQGGHVCGVEFTQPPPGKLLFQ